MHKTENICICVFKQMIWKIALHRCADILSGFIWCNSRVYSAQAEYERKRLSNSADLGLLKNLRSIIFDIIVVTIVVRSLN